VPVRLEIVGLPPSLQLQSGLSATVKVDTNHRRHLFGGSDETDTLAAKRS
jgi:hypothetical protein